MAKYMGRLLSTEDLVDIDLHRTHAQDAQGCVHINKCGRGDRPFFSGASGYLGASWPQVAAGRVPVWPGSQVFW